MYIYVYSAFAIRGITKYKKKKKCKFYAQAHTKRDKHFNITAKCVLIYLYYREKFPISI